MLATTAWLLFLMKRTGACMSIQTGRVLSLTERTDEHAAHRTRGLAVKHERVVCGEHAYIFCVVFSQVLINNANGWLGDKPLPAVQIVSRGRAR